MLFHRIQRVFEESEVVVGKLRTPIPHGRGAKRTTLLFKALICFQGGGERKEKGTREKILGVDCCEVSNGNTFGDVTITSKLASCLRLM